MILDALLQFSSSQAVTAAAASTNVIDLSNNRNVGSGAPLYIAVLVATTFADTGSDSTLAVALQTDDNAAFASPTTVATLTTLAALSAAGTVVFIPFPLANLERYIRLYFTPAGGDLSAGAVSAFLTEGIHNFKTYADASRITL